MDSEQHVLLIDGPVETEAVLRTVLEPRGVSVSRVRRGAAFSEACSPSLVVLHDEPAASDWAGIPRVVIGRATEADRRDGLCAIDRPFEYGELVEAIDRLLTDA